MGYWTKERTDMAVALWNGAGLSAQDIANRLGGTTRNAVIAKIFRLRNNGATVCGRNSALGPKVYKMQKKVRSLKKVRYAATPAKPASRLALAMKASPFKMQTEVLTPTVMSVSDLEAHSCRWPIGEPGHREFGFCGRERFMGLPYCAAHSSRAFIAPVVKTYAPAKTEEVVKAPELVPA